MLRAPSGGRPGDCLAIPKEASEKLLGTARRDRFTDSMTTITRFCLVLHNHQPIGNFDHVFEQAYQDSYLPFLDVFERYGDLKISLHTSGSLMEWLDEHHPEYVDRLAALVSAGPDRDHRRGVLRADPGDDSVAGPRRPDPQLHALAGEPAGRRRSAACGCPSGSGSSRSLSDLADAGIEYTVLDDFHFKNAGLTEDAAARLLPDRGRRAACSRLSRQRAAALHDPLRATRRRRSTTCGGIGRAASERGGRLRRRRREVRHLAGDQEARLRRRLAAAVLRRPGGQPATGSR